MAYDPQRETERMAGNGNGHGQLHESAFDTRSAPFTNGTTRNRSAGDLLRQLLGEVTVLLRKELALAASEVSQSVDEAKSGATRMATGGAVLYAGLLFLLAAATLWLSTRMELWQSALIVGAVVTIIGFIMLQTGKRHMSAKSFTPERTVRSLRKGKYAVERQMP